MAQLTARQRAHLKSLAHALPPVVHVGKEGITATVLGTLNDAFRTRELLKVKVLEAAPASARDTASEIEAGVSDVNVVQTIGRTIVLYRRHPEKPEIKLPR